jgi:hypothetical protein
MDRVLPSLLAEEEGLGAHTSVLNLSPSAGKRYSWYHHEVKPMGVSIALQCGKCGRLRSSVVAFNDDAIRVSCAEARCDHVIDIPRSLWRFQKKKGPLSGWGVQDLW